MGAGSVATRQYRWAAYLVRAAAIALATAVYAVVFILRRLFGASPHSSYTLVRQWAQRVLHFAGIQLQVRGAETLSNSNRYVFLANHASLFDIPVMIAASPLPLRILYKRQLRWVPFLGWALQLTNFIPVDRERLQRAGKVVTRTVAELEKDPAALLVFPEGTRTRDGQLGHFRRGAFAIAFASGRLLVPVAIKGTHALLPPTTLRFAGGAVEVEFLAPVAPPAYELSRSEERAWIERFRARIAQALET